MPIHSGSGAVNPIKRVIISTKVLYTAAITPISDTFCKTAISFLNIKMSISAIPPILINILAKSPK